MTPRRGSEASPAEPAAATVSTVDRWLGLVQSWPGRVDLAHERAAILLLDSRDPLPPIEGAADVLLASDRRRTRRDLATSTFVPLAALRRAGGVRTLRAFHPVTVVIHGRDQLDLRVATVVVASGARQAIVTLNGGATIRMPRRGVAVLGLLGTLHRILAALPVTRRLRRRLVPGWELPGRSVRGARGALRAAARARADTLARRGASAGAEPRGPLAITHYLGALRIGGAERQLVELALGQRRLGHRVMVAAEPSSSHEATVVRAELEAGGVEVRMLAPPWQPRALLRWIDSAPRAPERDLRRLVAMHPARGAVCTLASMLHETAPDVLHCWLDDPNAVGGLAGLLAAVPRVALSTRAMSPAHSTHLAKCWHRPSYRLLSRCEGIVLLANSEAGARDYSRWSGIALDRFVVIRNGLDPGRYVPLDPDARAAARASLGVTPDAFVVVGVLRLSAEKRPLDFVEAVARLTSRVPDVRAFLVGDGPEAPRVRERVARLDLGAHLTVVGHSDHPARYLAIADVSLLPSEYEGCPNAVLEAQALGVPVVVTTGGGSREVIIAGETGWLCGVGDVPGLSAALYGLAADPTTAVAMGRAGHTFVSERFSVDRMVEQTLDAYELPRTG